MVIVIATIVLAMPTYPPPKIEDLAWLEGVWRGKVGVDDVEETWSVPKNGSMMGMFRWFRDGKLRIMEMMTIAEFDGRITMKLKHFDESLHSLEPQNESTDFTLAGIERNRAIWSEVEPTGGPQTRLCSGRRQTDSEIRAPKRRAPKHRGPVCLPSYKPITGILRPNRIGHRSGSLF